MISSISKSIDMGSWIVWKHLYKQLQSTVRGFKYKYDTWLQVFIYVKHGSALRVAFLDASKAFYL